MLIRNGEVGAVLLIRPWDHPYLVLVRAIEPGDLELLVGGARASATCSARPSGSRQFGRSGPFHDKPRFVYAVAQTGEAWPRPRASALVTTPASSPHRPAGPGVGRHGDGRGHRRQRSSWPYPAPPLF